MVTQQEVKGGWTELKGKIQEHWGEISEDELKAFEGEANQLIGLIQQYTGLAREEIEEQLRQLDDRFNPFINQAFETAKDYAAQAAATARESADQVRQRIASGHADAKQVVQSRPMESVAVAFGAGIIAGVVVGLISRSR